MKHGIAVLSDWEEPTGKASDHLANLSELSKKIMALGESLNQAEKDMETTWIDEIEVRDLQNLKERMKAVEETVCILQEEVGHVEAEHCKKAKWAH